LAAGSGCTVVTFGVIHAQLPRSWGRWFSSFEYGVPCFQLIPRQPKQMSLF
jgi:hypothetical protein